MTLMSVHEVKTKLITISGLVDGGDRHWIELNNNKSYTAKQLGDIADTIKTYAQELDLIEKLY
jgi:hypothetical protein